MYLETEEEGPENSERSLIRYGVEDRHSNALLRSLTAVMNEAAVAFRCGEDSLSRVSVSAERLTDGRHRMLGYDAGRRIGGRREDRA
jgi:hypothetical protein